MCSRRIQYTLICNVQPRRMHTHACIHIIWILLLSDWNLSLTLLVKKIKKSYMKSITELPSFPLLLSPPSFSPSLPPLSRKERGLLWSAVCWFIALIHYCVYLTCLRKHVDGSYSASLFFFLPRLHTDDIVLLTNHIRGFAMSFEVGTLVGGPEPRQGGYYGEGGGGGEGVGGGSS